MAPIQPPLFTIAKKGPSSPHSLLKNHEDYKSAFQNRINHHFHTAGGAFSIDGETHQTSLLFQEAIDEVTPFMNLEFARWGDSSLQPSEGNPRLYRVDDPIYTPELQDEGQFGDFEAATL